MKNIANPLLRILAFVIDAGINWTVLFLLVLAIAMARSVPAMLDGVLGFVIWGMFFIPLLLVLLYCFLISRFGGSLGKLLTGIAIVDKEGKNLSFGKAFFRTYVGYVVSGMFLWLGFIWVFVDKDHRGWHDQIADTYVVNRNKFGVLVGLLALVIVLALNIFFLNGIITNFAANANGGVYAPLGKLMEEFSQSMKNSQSQSSSPTSQQSVNETYIKDINQTKLLWESGKNNEAMTLAKKALSEAVSDEEKAVAHYWIGLADYRNKDLVNAEREETTALNLFANYSSPYVTLAAIRMDQGNYQGAYDLAKKASVIDPKNAWAHNDMGLALFALGRKTEAITEFRQAVALDPATLVFRDNLTRAQQL